MRVISQLRLPGSAGIEARPWRVLVFLGCCSPWFRACAGSLSRWRFLSSCRRCGTRATSFALCATSDLPRRAGQAFPQARHGLRTKLDGLQRATLSSVPSEVSGIGKDCPAVSVLPSQALRWKRFAAPMTLVLMRITSVETVQRSESCSKVASPSSMRR